ncbi:MAG: glycosyltransferase family 4 protein [Sphaerochaetaceae bacterium]|nr:glycosyltransferase family 4 protein [Sphaerochaetaceae bacterium]
MVLKIALVCYNYHPENEGISVSVTRLAENLSNKCEMHIIAGKSSNKKIDFLKTKIKTHTKNNVKIHEVNINTDIKSEDYIWGLENLIYSIKKLNSKHDFDILHGYYLTPGGYITVLTSKLIGIPSVVGIRGNDIARDMLDYKQFHWIEWTLKNADYISALNSELLNLANALVPIKSKSKVIKNTAYFPMAEKAKKKKTKKLILGYLGDVKRKKGLIYLLEAINILKNEQIELQITGDVYKDEYPIYKEYIKKNKLNKKVKFLGAVSRKDISKRYNACDVVILPTISDGCPNVIFEAMELGKTLIVSDNVAVSQIIDNNETGLLIEQRNSKDIANKIKKLIDNPSLIDKLGKNAEKKVKTLTPEKETTEYLKIYKKLRRKK